MRLACVLIPRFPLALETGGHPEWHGKPVVLGGAPDERKAVVECSSRAELAGVQRGMPLREALIRCPDASFLEAHPEFYADQFERMLCALERVSPLVEGAELGCTFVGLDGLPDGGTPSGELVLARALVEAVQDAVGLTPRIGIADTRFAARSAALGALRRVKGEPSIQVVAEGGDAAFLAPLLVERLPLSDEMRRRLQWLGLRTASDLATLPRSTLAAQFGPEGVMAWELVHGGDDAPLIPRRYAPEVRGSLEFPTPVVEMPAILAAARHLLVRLMRLPECSGRATRGLDLDALLSNGHRWRRTVIFHEPVADHERMLKALAAKAGDAALPAPVESLELSLHGLCGEGSVQGRLFAGHGGTAHGLDMALDRLRARFGSPLIMKIVGVEPWSRLPERQYALIDYEPSTSRGR